MDRWASIRTNICPDCGKKILKTSKRCKSCSQKGKRNHQYTNGRTVSPICSNCGAPCSTGSKNLCQKCYFETLTGNGNPNYRNGFYSERVYNSTQYKAWRDSVYKRDRYTCQVCGSSVSGQLEAHHILPKRDFMEYVFNVDNGITLCKTCHEKTFGREYELINFFVNVSGRSKIAELSRNIPMGKPEPKAGNNISVRGND